MKKLISLLLALVMLSGFTAGLAEEKETSAIPATGDVIQGFEVKGIRDFPVIGAQLVLFEHQKTGGKLLWIANEDPNRVFQLTFPTRPSDDTGLPHVFEHATLFGSEKYPSNKIFFGVSNQTYNTYINAYTQDACTGYPMGSLSEKQLLAMADYYVDSCFHPLIMTDEGIFKTQAWHYNLPDPDGELTYEGVVYSEMQGALTLGGTALDNANRITFPGAALSYDYGGLPEKIPEMTWESVKSFHDKYYHPSNCFALLYGKYEDYSAFLKLLDDEFSQYEMVEFAEKDEGYTPITEPVVSSIPYPMAEGTDPTNQTVVYYYILCPGMKGDTAQETLIDHMCNLLNENASPLMRLIRDAFPASSVSCGREVAAPDDAVVFVANGLNENDAEAFKAVVDEALKEVAGNGFQQEMVDSAMHSLEISNRLASENTEPWNTIVPSFAYEYVVTGNPFKYAEIIDSYSALDEENREGLLKEACAKWLAEPALYTLTTTYPAPGEKEKTDAALQAKLAEIKSGMSDGELETIVAETNAEPAENDAAELIAKIRVDTVESLPEEVRIYPVSDETDGNGIRHIDVTAGVDGIGRVQLLLDAAALPQEDIHWMRLYTRLLGKLDTENHTTDELDILTARYLYEKTFGVNTVDLTDSIHPYVCAEWTALDEDLAAGYDLAEELLFRTKFDDTAKLVGQVEKQITNVRGQINSEAYWVMVRRGLADRYPFYRFYSYMNYTDYYAFLLQLKDQLAENPEEVAEHFRTLQAFFANSAGAVSAYAGNAESIAQNRTLADGFMAKLGHEEREAAVYDLPVPAAREALIIDGNVQYNHVTASADDIGLEGFDAGLAATANVVSDRLLVPVLRDQMGVYTPIAGEMENGSLYLFTYRDPNLRETFDFYASLADEIAKLDVPQEDLDGYIMSAYSEYAMPTGELSGANNAVQTVLERKSQEDKLEYLRQLKAVTPESIQASAEIFRKAWENGVHSTAGSAAAINGAVDLFDAILNPFNAQDTSEVEFTDVQEGHEYYDAIRFVYESGIMAPVAENAFGAEDAATVGDLLGGIYACLGGAPNAAEEARDWLAGHGIVPADQDLSELLTEQFLCDVTAGIFGAEVFTTEEPDKEIPRGDLADTLKWIYEQVNQQ